VLTSLLPGLRDLRAPLSAGILWLLALWFLVEPALPDEDRARGILASAYRLAEPLSALGLGAVVGFAAYLLGSLSVFLFSRRLRRLIPATARSARFALAGLSPGGEKALNQVARDSHHRLEETLSLSGSGVDDVLMVVEEPRPGPDPRASKRHPSSAEPTHLTAWNAPRTSEQEQEATLAGLVVRDLEVIANAQLLGKENDVFSAVDRNRAELEFRLAVIPPLVGLTVALAVRQSSPWTAGVVALLGVVVAAGLLLDAAQQPRAANDLLLNLLEHDRVRAPSLTRLEVRAKEIADQSPAAVPRMAGETSTNIRVLIDLLENLARSGAATVPQAVDAAIDARRAFDRTQALLREFGPDEAPLDPTVLADLEIVVNGWLARDPATWSTLPRLAELYPHGLPPYRPDPQQMAEGIERATKALPALRDEMRRQALAIAARQAASDAPAVP
jgi:hypothetical protein